MFVVSANAHVSDVFVYFSVFFVIEFEWCIFVVSASSCLSDCFCLLQVQLLRTCSIGKRQLWVLLTVHMLEVYFLLLFISLLIILSSPLR